MTQDEATRAAARRYGKSARVLSASLGHTGWWRVQVTAPSVGGQVITIDVRREGGGLQWR